MNKAEQIANASHTALKNEDWEALREVLTKDAKWKLLRPVLIGLIVFWKGKFGESIGKI